MRRVDRSNTVKILKQNRIIVDLPDQPVNELFKVINDSISKGVRAFTVMDTEPLSFERYLLIKKEFADSPQHVLIGVSNISHANNAALYVDAQVAFIVGSNFDEPTAKRCNRSGTLYVPYCRESNEVNTALDFGLEIILFALNGINHIAKIVNKIKNENSDFSQFALINIDDLAEKNARFDEKLDLIDGIMVNQLSLTDDLLRTIEKKSVTSFSSGNRQKDYIGFNQFSGIEHIGLYQTTDVSAREIAEWYAKTFGFELQELDDCVLLESFGAGRIEVVKQNTQSGVHIAVQVEDMEAAIHHLSDKGIETEPTVILPNISWTYLKQTDPLGNHVHLVWRKKE